MAKFCKEAIATDQWAREHEVPGTERDCSTCKLGSTTAFFASGSLHKLSYFDSSLLSTPTAYRYIVHIVILAIHL